MFMWESEKLKSSYEWFTSQNSFLRTPNLLLMDYKYHTIKMIY